SSSTFPLLLLSTPRPLLLLHPFPTRRSSDLASGDAFGWSRSRGAGPTSNSQSRPRTKSMGQTLKTASIVLVEDNPADVLLVRKALQEKGIKCELTCFEAGEKALKNLSQEGRLAPDLILLDLNLPGADGVDVLRKICSIPRLSEVPVVILTSSESPSDIQRTARIGAARYIRKPSRLEDFLTEVGRAVEEMLLRSGSG